MNYIKYSHCSALKYRVPIRTGSTLLPEDYLFVRSGDDAEDSKTNKQEEIVTKVDEDENQVLGE